MRASAQHAQREVSSMLCGGKAVACMGCSDDEAEEEHRVCFYHCMRSLCPWPWAALNAACCMCAVRDATLRTFRDLL